MHPCRTILSKEIITDTARSTARVLQTPEDVRRNGTDRTTPWDGNTSIWSTSLASPVCIGGSNTGSPRRTGIQDIISPRGSIGTKWIRDAQPLDTYINGIYSKHRDPAPNWIKVSGRKFTEKSSPNINSRFRMNLTRDDVLTESPNVVNLDILSVHTSNELGSVFIPTTRIGTPTEGSNWLPPGYCIGEVTEDILRRTR